MEYNVNVWDEDVFDETTNKIRHDEFLQKLKRIKNLVVKEEHKNYAVVIADSDFKIKNLIVEDFSGIGSCKKIK